VAEAVGQVGLTGETQQVVFRIAAGLYTRWAHAKLVPLKNEDQVTGWIATVEDITERRHAESQLAHQATHDSLTGLPNRTLLADRLAQARGRLRRDSTSITVVFVDLDEFKEVNDTHGHRAGDLVLIEVAQRLRRIMRASTVVVGSAATSSSVRVPPEDEASSVVGRIHDVPGVPLVVEGHRVTIGAAPPPPPTPGRHDRLLALADQSMYREAERRRRRIRPRLAVRAGCGDDPTAAEGRGGASCGSGTRTGAAMGDGLPRSQRSRRRVPRRWGSVRAPVAAVVAVWVAGRADDPHVTATGGRVPAR
jgi:diguanylate cyclase (GGDEF)-like protein